MEITRIARVNPSENITPPKLPKKKAVISLGLALPIVLSLSGCVVIPEASEIQMIPTPDFWAQQTEHKPIRVVSEDLNTLPQSTRQAIETKSKSSITEALIFDVSQGNPDGYVIDKDQKNASEISFDLYTLSNGKMVGTFPSENGTINMTEVIGVDEITSDGYVYRTLKTIVNNNGQDEEHIFIALGYGQVETASNISSLDGTGQQALVQSQIEKNQVESIIFGNPYLPSPNAIVLIEDKNFQGQKDITFTDSLKNIGYQVKFVSSQQNTLSTNTPLSPTEIPTLQPTGEATTQTSTPTATATETPTAVPTTAPTETLSVVEKDLNPAYTETVSQEFMGVKINSELITDASLDPEYKKITVSKEAYAEFIARTIFKVWWSKSEESHTGTPTDQDFGDFMKLWSQAQKSGLPDDWKKVQLDNIWANDLNDGNGYVQKPYTIWPMYEGQTPEGVRGVDNMAIAFVNGTSFFIKNITIFSGSAYNSGMGTNLDGKTLYIYAGIPVGLSEYSIISWSGLLSASAALLIRNVGTVPIGYPGDQSLAKILSNGGLKAY